MNTHHPHHVTRKLVAIKTWYVLVIFLLSLSVSIIALRNNNEHMAKLRSEVYAADKSDGDVTGALRNLQAYVTANMNTNLSGGPNAVYPPIQLKYTYQRLVQAASAQAASSNAQLYTAAQNYCQAQDPTDFSGHNRVPCIEQYVESHGVQVPTIPVALYEFDFVSPIWSPDFAGWSLVVAVVSGVITVVCFVTRRYLHE